MRAWLFAALALVAGCDSDGDPGGGGPCEPDEYLDFGDDRCGEASDEGTCRLRPEGCPDNYQPTCGCDGEVYGNECDAAAAGTDLNDNATCTPPTDLFACGHGFCNVAIEYCERFGTDIGGTPDSWQCLPLPAACGGVADCDCVVDEPCGASCDDSTGDLLLTCFGG